MTETTTKGRLPNLVMVGLGKAGTTSLFYYLSQHPAICAADVKEIQYFRPITDGYEGLTSPEEYAAHFSHCSTEGYRLEASPQYFHGGERIIAAMKGLLPEPKVIVTLRNPIDRMWSTYRSAKVRHFLPGDLTFEAYVERCEQVFRSDEPVTTDNRPFRTLAGGFYAPHVKVWLDAFGDDARIVFFERLAADSAAVVKDVCGWLDVDPACVDGFDLSTQNETRAARSFLVHRVAVAANSERFLRSRRRLKAPLRRFYYALNGRRASERMSPATRRHLEEIFAPGNEALARELADRGYRDFPDWVPSPSEAAEPVAGHSEPEA